MNLNDSACHPGDGTKELNRLPYLAEPLLRFDLQQELQNLRREDSWDRETGRSSKTLAKYPDFRIVLVLMQCGSALVSCTMLGPESYERSGAKNGMSVGAISRNTLTDRYAISLEQWFFPVLLISGLI